MALHHHQMQADIVYLDFRNMDICSGPCNMTTPMSVYDSKAKSNKLYHRIYPGHENKIGVKNGYLCFGCEARYEECWDVLEWGLECKTEKEINEARTWFDRDGQLIQRKFIGLTAGSVHYLSTEIES